MNTDAKQAGENPSDEEEGDEEEEGSDGPVEAI